MYYHAIFGTKKNMQGEKSTCLPCQMADSLPRIVVLDFSRTTRCLHVHTNKNKQQIRNNTTNSKNRERYGVKDVARVARIA